MPLFETACKSEQCGAYGLPVEHFYHHAEFTPSDCEICGQPTVKLWSTFNSPFTGFMSNAKYGSKHAEPRKNADSHVMYRRNSSKSGAPEPVLIETWEDQRRYCREENLLNPTDLPTGAQISKDGRKWETKGMPGQWV